MQKNKELMVLGTARQQLGQKKRHWSQAKNEAMLANMDTDNNGLVEKDEFVRNRTLQVS